MIRQEQREPWQMTREEYEVDFGKPARRTTVTGGFHPHREAVAIAINRGLPVPDEVLADYQDLLPFRRVSAPENHIAARTHNLKAVE